MNTNKVIVSFQIYDRSCEQDILDYADSHNMEVNSSIKGFNGIDVLQITASIVTMIQFVDWLITKTKGKRNIYFHYSSENEEFDRLTPDQVKQVLDKENTNDDNVNHDGK